MVRSTQERKRAANLKPRVRRRPLRRQSLPRRNRSQNIIHRLHESLETAQPPILIFRRPDAARCTPAVQVWTVETAALTALIIIVTGRDDSTLLKRRVVTDILIQHARRVLGANDVRDEQAAEPRGTNSCCAGEFHVGKKVQARGAFSESMIFFFELDKKPILRMTSHSADNKQFVE